MPSVSRQSDEHDDIPNPTPEQRHDTSEDEVAVDDYQEQTHADSDDTHDSEVIKIYDILLLLIINVLLLFERFTYFLL